MKIGRVIYSPVTVHVLVHPILLDDLLAQVHLCCSYCSTNNLCLPLMVDVDQVESTH